MHAAAAFVAPALPAEAPASGAQSGAVAGSPLAADAVVQAFAPVALPPYRAIQTLHVEAHLTCERWHCHGRCWNRWALAILVAGHSLFVELDAS